VVAAGLGEIAAGDDSQLGGESLEQDRHQVGNEDHAQERVSELGSAGEIGRPVAGVHVADGYEVARPGEGQDLPEPMLTRDRNGPVNLG
jgi:hypothetical protein